MSDPQCSRLIAVLVLATTICLHGAQDDNADVKSAPAQPLRLLLVGDMKPDDVGLRAILEKTAGKYASSDLTVDIITKNVLMNWICLNCPEFGGSQDGLKFIKYAEKKGYAAIGGLDRIVKQRRHQRRPRAGTLSEDATPKEIAPWIYNLRRGSYSFGVDQPVLENPAPMRLTDAIEFRHPSKNKLPFAIPVDFTREASYTPNSLVTSFKMHQQLETWAWGTGGLFVLNQRNGERIDLTQIKSKLIIISFWGVRPPASEAYLLPLYLIQRKYSRNDLCWLSVNADSGRTDWLRYMEQNPLDGVQCILGQSNVQPEFSQFNKAFVMDREKQMLREYEIGDVSIVVDRFFRK